MVKPTVLVLAWVPDGILAHWQKQFAGLEFIDGREPALLGKHLGRAEIIYGIPSVEQCAESGPLRWVQLTSAGVPQDLCALAEKRGLQITNLAGLYGPSIAEHAIGLMLMLARKFQIAVRQQVEQRWDRGVARSMSVIHGRTLAIIGLGSIGRSSARLAHAFGMRVLGCRRTDRPTPDVDRLYPCGQFREMLPEADFVAVAAPLTRHTESMLGRAEFQAMKRGAFYINVSRGGVAEESALLDALQSGQLAGAGLDVFGTEPPPAGHPFWAMPQVIMSPHVSGETVNQSPLPAERFARNLHAWLNGRPLEGMVNLKWGY
jgi:phosphoglycerate dehydrogenase-like enzyme